jgi:anti-sigma regulatory factor (Ser/Thr protein kinase)
VAACAATAGLAGDRLDDFVVAVNELLTNAVQHGGGRGHVALWRASGAVVCEITDAGTGMPESAARGPHPPAADQPGGRGLWLASRLTDGLEIDSDDGGTAVRVSASVV